MLRSANTSYSTFMQFFMQLELKTQYAEISMGKHKHKEALVKQVLLKEIEGIANLQHLITALARAMSLIGKNY